MDQLPKTKKEKCYVMKRVFENMIAYLQFFNIFNENSHSLTEFIFPKAFYTTIPIFKMFKSIDQVYRHLQFSTLYKLF